jgi:hypothetical protein
MRKLIGSHRSRFLPRGIMSVTSLALSRVRFIRYLIASGFIGGMVGSSGWSQPNNRASIKVGRNVLVSSAPGHDTLMYVETIADANPRDPKHLVACSMVSIRPVSDSRSLLFSSFDGGNTWTEGVRSEKTGFDPDCWVGKDGTTYMLSGMNDSGVVYVWRSSDGKSFGKPTLIPNVADRPWLAVDRSPSSPHSGNVYMLYTTFPKTIDRGGKHVTILNLVTSRDAGATFSSPINVLQTNPDTIDLILARPVVLSNGTVVFVYSRRAGGELNRLRPKRDGSLELLMTSDGGRTFSAPIHIADEWAAQTIHTRTLMAVAVDPGSPYFKDRIYVAWGDFRSGRSEIMLSYSADSGKTWSKPRVVSDDRPAQKLEDGPDNALPVLAVNKDGVVGVQWYDRRNSRNNVDYEVRFSASLDGGETWAPSVVVSEYPHTYERAEMNDIWPDATPAGKSASGEITISLSNSLWTTGGHTAGLSASADGAFHPTWIDNHTKYQQVYTAPITVSGQVAPHGSTALATLRDLTQKTTIEISGAMYNQETRTLRVAVQLKNISSDTLRGPFKLRLTSLRSATGVLRLTNADNKEPGPGALLDFSETTLLPNAMTQKRSLVFTLSEVRRTGSEGGWRSLLDAQGRVLGARQPNVGCAAPPP